MGLPCAPVDFTGAIASTKADTNTSAIMVEIRFIFCLLIRIYQILWLPINTSAIMVEIRFIFCLLIRIYQILWLPIFLTRFSRQVAVGVLLWITVNQPNKRLPIGCQ